MTKFGEALTRHLAENDKGIYQWVRENGLVPSTVYNYMSVKAGPNVFTAMKLAKALGTTVYELWGDEAESFPVVSEGPYPEEPYYVYCCSNCESNLMEFWEYCPMCGVKLMWR